MSEVPCEVTVTNRTSFPAALAAATLCRTSAGVSPATATAAKGPRGGTKPACDFVTMPQPEQMNATTATAENKPTRTKFIATLGPVDAEAKTGYHGPPDAFKGAAAQPSCKPASERMASSWRLLDLPA